MTRCCADIAVDKSKSRKKGEKGKSKGFKRQEGQRVGLER